MNHMMVPELGRPGLELRPFCRCRSYVPAKLSFQKRLTTNEKHTATRALFKPWHA